MRSIKLNVTPWEIGFFGVLIAFSVATITVHLWLGIAEVFCTGFYII